MLLREWASVAYPGVQLLEQFRLGPTTSNLVGVVVTPALEAALRVNNWFADGVILAPHETAIVEAKVKPTPGAISQVQFYSRLIARTPQLQNRLALPIVPIVLFAENDPDVTSFAQTQGVRVAVYTPPWIQDYLQLVQFRYRAPGPSGTSGESGEGQGSPST
jgi:hypothetical protein